jgi:hypothetical protein
MGDENISGVAPQGVPVAKPVSPVVQQGVVKKQRNYGLILLVGVVVVVLIAVVVSFVLLNGRGEGFGGKDYGELAKLYKLSQGEEEEVGGEEELLKFLEVVEDLSLAEKVGLCLGGGTMGEECEALFKERGIGDACEGLGDLRDDCFFSAATINSDESFCDEISDEGMKGVCGFEFSLELPIA